MVYSTFHRSDDKDCKAVRFQHFHYLKFYKLLLKKLAHYPITEFAGNQRKFQNIEIILGLHVKIFRRGRDECALTRNRLKTKKRTKDVIMDQRVFEQGFHEIDYKELKLI